MEEFYDVFLCHAGEDKDEYIKPLSNQLENAGISTWLDALRIEWGDSITKKVNEGLRISKYVIVFFSNNFFNKNWPERELNSVLNKMASSGKSRILPILVSKSMFDEYSNNYPLLNDLKAMFWEDGVDAIINSLNRLLKKENTQESEDNNSVFNIPMPKVKKVITKREQDQFLISSFDFIKDFFKKGSQQLGAEYTDVNCDFLLVHNLKFICSLYYKGELINKCKIWAGGSFGRDAISYYENLNIDVNSDSTSNDSLSVDIDNNKLSFSTSASIFGQSNKSLTMIDGAEYLWKKFIKVLEQ